MGKGQFESSSLLCILIPSCLSVLVLTIMMNNGSLKILEMLALGECTQNMSFCPSLTPLLLCCAFLSFQQTTFSILRGWRGVSHFFILLYPWGTYTSKNIPPLYRRHLHLPGPHRPPAQLGFFSLFKSPSFPPPVTLLCSHILRSLHSVLESQENHYHK